MDNLNQTLGYNITSNIAAFLGGPKRLGKLSATSRGIYRKVDKAYNCFHLNGLMSRIKLSHIPDSNFFEQNLSRTELTRCLRKIEREIEWVIHKLESPHDDLQFYIDFRQFDTCFKKFKVTDTKTFLDLLKEDLEVLKEIKAYLLNKGALSKDAATKLLEVAGYKNFFGDKVDPTSLSSDLEQAILYQNKTLISAMIECGADPNRRNFENLQVAIHKEDFDTASLLLQHKANPNTENSYRKSILLHDSIEKESLKCVQLLIQYNAQVNAVSHRTGLTALSVAMIKKQDEMIKELLKAGADPNINIKRRANSESPTEMHLRSILKSDCRPKFLHRYAEIGRLLIQYKANIDVLGEEDEKAIQRINEHYPPHHPLVTSIENLMKQNTGSTNSQA